MLVRRVDSVRGSNEGETMAEKKKSPTGALVTVVEALEPLEEADRQ
jgi:hypothetical protein